MIALLLLACLGVSIGPGWSNPFLATDSANSTRRSQFLHHDNLGRFHLTWEGMNDEPRIGYKMFALDGTELFPEAMISRNVISAYLSTVVQGDSLYIFWREYNPIYYAIRSLSDGSEITPATYLFTTYTQYAYIRACPDSLGRLHVLYNDGPDVIYAVWNPAPGSGFITEYEWVIEEADLGGVLLVDGNRVHVVVQDSLSHTYEYLQYDLEGNTVVPQIDFTDDVSYVTRFPVLVVDSDENLLVLERTVIDEKGIEGIYLWKLDGETGDLLIDMKPVIISSQPEMRVSNYFIVEPLHIQDQFYLCWARGDGMNKVFNLIFDSDGNIIVDWHVAYDYSDEDPEDTKNIDGVTDENGNLYIVYAQVETEPEVDYFPTFGWFDYSYLGINDSSTATPNEPVFQISQNPITTSVTISASENLEDVISIYDIYGREVSSISISGGTAVWYGKDYSGERLPTGVYSFISSSGLIQRITLINR